MTTTEVRPSAYETGVTWGEDGPEVEQFGTGLAFEKGGADANHEEICEQVEAAVGLARVPPGAPPAA